MFVYNCRIFDHYNRTVVSLAVLADDDPGWRPSSYREDLWDWSVEMSFPTVKILDYANQTEALEASSNPFAMVVLAHLKALETRRDPEARQRWKFYLVRRLHERGFKSKDVRQLFRVIDWLLELPPPLKRRFVNEVHNYEEERSMPFMTTIKWGARLELLLEVIEDALRVKFGDDGAKLMPEIDALNDLDKLRALHKITVKATTLEEVRRACTAAAAPEAPRKRTRSKRG